MAGHIATLNGNWLTKDQQTADLEDTKDIEGDHQDRWTTCDKQWKSYTISAR